MTKYRVARVLTRLGAGGPPIQAVTVNRELRRRGIDCRLICGSCDPADGDMSYLLDPTDAVTRIPAMSRAVSPWNDVLALIRLVALLRRERPAVVHTHTAKAGALGRIAARIAGVPVVVHTFHGNVCNHYFSPAVSFAVRAVERALTVLTDVVCVLSPQQMRELSGELGIVPESKARIVPLGFDLDPFTRIPPPGGGPFTVGWFGRLVAVKNIPLMIETIQTADPRIRFVIAGDGPERPAVESAAARFGPTRCEFLGWQRDVAPVLARCHVLLQTSRNEGTPAALIQGMAAGRPFVSTPAGGVVDLVTGPNRDGWCDNGVLAESPSSLAFALGRLSADPDLAGRMGRCARAFALSRFTLDSLADSLDALYRELLEAKGLAPAG